MNNANDRRSSCAGTTRRALLLGVGATLPLCAIRTRPASAAEFTYKLATGQDPTHPVNKRGQEAIDRIREETGGRVEIRLSRPTSSALTPTCLARCAMAASSSSTSPRRYWQRWCPPPGC